MTDRYIPQCLLFIFSLWVFLPVAAQAAIPGFTLSAQRAGIGDARLQGLVLEYSQDAGLSLSIAQVETEDDEPIAGTVELHCPGELDTIRLDLCTEGQLKLNPGMGLPVLEVKLANGSLEGNVARLQGSANLGHMTLEIQFEGSADNWQGQLGIPKQSLTEFRALLNAWEAARSVEDTESGQIGTVAAWMRSGLIEGEINIRNSGRSGWSPEFSIDISGLSFDSPEGQYAGEALAMHWTGQLRESTGIALALDLTIGSGELLLGDFYRNFADGSLQLQFEPQWQGSRLRVDSILISDGGALELAAVLEEFDSAQGGPESLVVDNLSLKFPEAYTRYLESIAAIWTLDGLELTGDLGWRGKLDISGNNQMIQTGEMQLDGIGVSDSRRGRFAVSGLTANIDASYLDFLDSDVPQLGVLEPEDSSQLSWENVEFGPIVLGPAQVALEHRAGGVGIAEPLDLQVLGGVFTLSSLAYAQLPGKPLDISLEAELQGLDMALLTEAFDWPVFQGEISGSIPGVSFTDGIVSVGGALEIAVFDGEMVLRDVRIERAFGVLPSLAANIDARGLDLELLTSTFEFGQIAGRMDGYVHGLRMLDWEPVSFDAWLGTPESTAKSKKDISRQAVNHLTAIGGGGATAALTGPVMKLFNNFSYKRIGLGCVLQNNICEIRGLDDDEQSVLIMEGSGIPKIMIRAFNRNLDWPRLVDQLLAVSGGDSIRIGD